MHSYMLRAIRELLNRLLIFFDGFLLLFFPSKCFGTCVLIVRLDAIGDFVLWLDAAKVLVSSYHGQGYSVVLLGNKAWASWAKEMEVADEVWEIDVSRFSKQPLYRWQWLIRIRKAGFKIAIQPTYSRIFTDGDSVVRASGANERIGSIGDESNITWCNKSWSNRWYTRIISAKPTQIMELKRNAEFMRGLGFSDFLARLPSIPLSSGKPTNLLPPQPYAVLVPAASWEGKEWPIDNFIKIGHQLAAVGLHIVVLGVSADRERVSVLLNDLPDAVVDLVGKTTLGELAEVLRCATLVLTNDTSSVHIGVAVDVPVVCILGGGHFGRFAPYDIEVVDENRNLPIIVAEPMPCFGCNWHCKYPRRKGEAVKCIQDISVGKVWGAVEAVLTKRGYIEISAAQ